LDETAGDAGRARAEEKERGGELDEVVSEGGEHMRAAREVV
jgi:hypothetical protein